MENIMANLEDTVRSVVQDFISREVLFTALDVSNAVKQQLPHTKHREVRDAVRGMFTTDIEGQGWARTPITVNLPDKTQAEALLYHPLTDSWDLDNKYDTQARQATSYRPAASAAATVAAAQAQTTVPAGTPISVAAGFSSITVDTTGISIVAPSVTVQGQTIPAPVASPRDQWKSLFDTQPSLFPKR
jgi:hypothetical protein